MAENIDKAKENSLQTANCEKDNCAHYIDKQYTKFYKSKFLLILAGFSFAVVALFIFVTYSYNKSQGDIVNNYRASNPQPIGFSGILLAKRQNSFYCTYFLHNRNVADTKSPYPIKRLEVIRWFNQKSMVFNQSLS